MFCTPKPKIRLAWKTCPLIKPANPDNFTFYFCLKTIIVQKFCLLWICSQFCPILLLENKQKFWSLVFNLRGIAQNKHLQLLSAAARLLVGFQINPICTQWVNFSINHRGGEGWRGAERNGKVSSSAPAGRPDLYESCAATLLAVSPEAISQN